MATLSNEKRRIIRKRKIRLIITETIISLLLTPYAAAYINKLILNKFNYKIIRLSYFESLTSLIINQKQLMIFGVLEGAFLLFVFYISTQGSGKIKPTDTMFVTDNIEIPIPVGQGQHGNARFMSNEEKDNAFFKITHDTKKGIDIKGNIGLVIGMTKRKSIEIIHCIKQDINSIIIGATRSGKTRRIIFITIWLRALAGKSMVITDVKGELFLFTKKLLSKLGFNIIDFDIRQPLKSKKFNYMQKIIQAIEAGDIPKAIDYTWDFVSVLVGVPKGEPLWTNGESATIASGILIVATQAEKKYRNLTNVYMFLAKMCKADENGRMPITTYLETLPDEHPAKMVFDIAEISPEKMRGSFFGMALTTLRLFTNWNIADLTSESEFELEDLGKKKTALFIIVPDEKQTYYPLVSLFINQVYVSLVELANKTGGRLPVEVDMLLEEIGNFPEIPGLGSMISAGLSRGIRFTLVIQDYQQLEKKYKEDFANIKSNCLVTIYLKTTDQKTMEELSKKTDTYTVEVNSASNSTSTGRKNEINYSNSVSMQSRALLTPGEIGRIEAPYSLIFYSGKYPAIFINPDLSEYKVNALYGLGDEEYNRRVYMERDSERKEREPRKIDLWEIWKMYDDKPYPTNVEEAQPKRERAVSFLK